MTEDSSQPTLFQQIFNSPQRKTWRIISSLLTFFWVIAIISLAAFIRNHPAYSHSIKLLVVLIGFVFLQIGLFVIVWVKHGFWISRVQEYIEVVFHRLGKVNLVFACLPIGIFLLLVLGNREYAPLLSNLWVRIYLLLWSSLAAAVFVSFVFHRSFLLHWFQVTLVFGAMWMVLSYFPLQPAYPFSYTWSETSWYYNASFFVARSFYKTRFPWPFFDIGRFLLLSIPYFLTIRSLVVERIWQGFLWIGNASIVVLLLLKRLKLPKFDSRWMLFLWGFVWMLIGPVYYHLTVSVMIVLATFNSKKMLLSFLGIGIASIFSGIMRLNWIPVPAMLGILLFVIDTPYEMLPSFLKYITRPIIIGVIGAGIGLASFISIVIISGRADAKVTTRLTAPFLWYRLFPNATFILGIIPGALFLASVLLIFILRYRQKALIHPLRLVLIYLILAILFLGGVYASLKIGGGNNLHNLDAFWVASLIILFYTLANKVSYEKPFRVGKWRIGFTLLLICVPFFFLMTLYPDLTIRNYQIAQSELTQIKTKIRSIALSSGKVLFISNRHLITFNYVEDIPLIPEYETEELMEMAMAGNDAYINKFKSDLATKKYQAIVIDQVNLEIQGTNHSFSEENNAWREDVVLPLLEYYQITLTLPQSHLEVYQPIP